jgi:hypothetical protein
MNRAVATVSLLLLLSGPAAAQGLIGGYAVEHSSGRPLRCIRVSLLDSSGTVVDSTRTLQGGLFQLMAPGPGGFRLRFSAGGLTDVLSDVEHIGADEQVARQYRIPLYLDSATQAFIESGKGNLRGLRPRFGNRLPRYPEELKRAGVEGDVVLAFAIDRAGAIDTTTVIPLRVTHVQFFRAVNKVLPRTRYQGWKEDPNVDCVLGIQPFNFRMH